MRLVGSGSTANQGRLEVYAKGQWGTVCNDLWWQEPADVVCKQLGFPRSSQVRWIKTNKFGEGTLPILLNLVRCGGNEASLMDCRMAEIGNNVCDHSQDVAVTCYGSSEGKSPKSPNKI